MTYLEAILLGIVQGITEFLPISSDGHLMVAQHWLGMNVEDSANNVLVTVALHAGTLLSIVVYFYRDLMATLKKPKLIVAIIVATLPLIPLGLFGKELIDHTLQTMPAAGAGFLLTAAFLFAAGRMQEGTKTLDEITPVDALVVGCLQALAPAPGVSRSGSTIFGGLARGLNRDAAARFAFLIAVPAISGAIVLYCRKLLKGGQAGVPLGPVLVGAAVSFFVGVAAIRVLMAVVIRKRLAGFAWYCLVLGTVVVGFSLAQGEPFFRKGTVEAKTSDPSTEGTPQTMRESEKL